MTQNHNGTVLLIDVENVIGLCNTLKNEGLLEEIDIKPVCDKLTEMFGPLRYRKSFGDIAYSCSKTSNHHWIRSLRKNFYDNLIEMHDVPNFGGYKNMADTTIITEALSIAFDNQDISVFAIFSSDADYVPLYTKLKERGKTVVIIGMTQDSTSSILTKAADYMFYYQHLISPDKVPPAGQPIPNSYSNLVLRAATSILDQGVPLHGSALLIKIRQLQSDFDYKQLGFKKFIDFLKDIEESTNAISVIPHPELSGDMTITLNETQIKASLPSPSEPMAPQDRRSEPPPLALPQEYKTALEKKLRCPLLANTEYRRCCEAVEAVFRREVLDRPGDGNEIRLVDLKNLVMAELINDPLFSQLTVGGKLFGPLDSILYKFIKALYLSGTFCVSQKADQAEYIPDIFNNNPSLSVFYNDQPDLLERFYFCTFYILKGYDLPLDANALAQLFFKTADQDDVEYMAKLVDGYHQQHNIQTIAYPNGSAQHANSGHVKQKHAG
jgi:uncharacterized LabA/DUF88 family protein